MDNKKTSMPFIKIVLPQDYIAARMPGHTLIMSEKIRHDADSFAVLTAVFRNGDAETKLGPALAETEYCVFMYCGDMDKLKIGTVVTHRRKKTQSSSLGALESALADYKSLTAPP